MQLKRKKRQAGDTLVEVLLAFSIFGAAATTITRAMNEGFVQMFTSGQQSQVQGLMRGQLAIVQAAHDNEVKDPSSNVWNLIINEIADSDTEKRAAVNADGCTYSQNKNRLYFATANGGTWTQPQSVDKVAADQPVAVSTVTPSPNGNSMWIEARYTQPGTDSRGYYDFYAKSCWTDGRINRQLKTVLRLYDLVPPASEGSPLTPTAPPATPPTPPTPVVMNGRDFETCVGKADTDREEWENEHGDALFANGFPGNPYGCSPLNNEPLTTFSCTSYDIRYRPPATLEPGRYRLTLEYLDANCGQWPGPVSREDLSGLGYSFNLVVYVNGVAQPTRMNLVAQSGVGTSTYDFDSPGQVNTIEFRWWNNHFIGASSRDPDLVISRLSLVEIP